MVSLSDVRKRRDEILRVAARHGAHDPRLFGSVLHGQAGPTSDLDLLVHLDDDRSLVDHVALIQDLEDLLGWRVDAVNERALHRAIRSRVLAEAVPL